MCCERERGELAGYYPVLSTHIIAHTHAYDFHAISPLVSCSSYWAHHSRNIYCCLIKKVVSFQDNSPFSDLSPQLFSVRTTAATNLEDVFRRKIRTHATRTIALAASLLQLFISSFSVLHSNIRSTYNMLMVFRSAQYFIYVVGQPSSFHNVELCRYKDCIRNSGV